MKWLLLLPVWVFFICYVVWKLRDGGAGSPEPQVYRHTDPQELATSPAAAKGGQLMDREQRVSGAQMEIVAAKLREQVQLLPITEDGCGMSPIWPIGAMADIVTGLTTCSGFPSWRLFESGELSFYIPNGKGMRVEVVDGGGRMPMTGELFYRNETSPDRWYRIVAADNITWGALAVDGGSLFDDRERYPVAETFHRTMVRGGGIARFSLDAGGHVCRAEWLGEGKRVSLLAWQHGSMHRDAYLALAASIELGDMLRRPESQLQGIVRSLTLTNRLRMGLLERGMRREEVQNVLGKPIGIAGDLWLYHSPQRNGDQYYRVAFGKDGTFRGLKNDWIEIRKDPPIRGTIEWLLEKTEIRAGKAGGIGYDIGALSDKDVVFIFEQVRQRIRSAGGEQWTGLCRVLANLADLGLQDEEILQGLRVRFLEDAIPIRPAIVLLWKWDPAGGRNLFVQKAKDMLGSLRWQSPAPGSVAGNVADLRVLLDFIGGSHSASEQLIKTMAGHPHIEVRVIGFSFWRWLQGNDLRMAALKGLIDTSDQVRLYCAEALASGCAIPADSAFLQERLEQEHVTGIREHLTAAIIALQEP